MWLSINSEKMLTLREKINYYYLSTQKELVIQYKNSTFGFIWFFLGVVLQVLIVGFIFSYFIKIENYFLFLVSGLIPWYFLSNTIVKASSSFVQNSDLLQKTYFPRETIPFSVVFAKALQMIVSIGLIILTLLVSGYNFDFKILLVFIPLIWLILLASVISLMISILSVIYRDLSSLLQLIISIWFYSTPVIYSLNMVSGITRYLYFLNPMVSVIELFHYSFNVQTSLSLDIFIFNIFITLIFTIFSVRLFYKYNTILVDLL